jgi:ABC-type multidrug transport system ATPase subunit
MTTAAAPFRCHGVEVRYGRVVALAGLDLVAEAGRVTGLVGPNGAGKTTTLRLAAGLVRPCRGEVRVGDVEPARRPTAARRLLGFLPDRPALPPHLSAREMITLRARLYGISGAVATSRLAEVAAELRIEPLLDRFLSALSHGQAQRVALAAVLLPEPPLLLVDEPMTALDLDAQIRVREVLRSRAERGAAVVLTTHTVDHVAALADRVVHLRDGRVSAERDGTRDVRELERWLLDSCS